MKTCSKCNIEKHKYNFNKSKKAKDGLFSYCKECRKKVNTEWRNTNSNYMSEYYNRNSEELLQKSKEWYSANKEYGKYIRRKYSKENRNIKNTLEAKRRSNKLIRTPKWASLEKIKSYYNVCAFFNEVNGYTKYHVDHIIPLQGKLVSGLHVENNLQVILAEDNIKKGNRYNGRI